MDKTKDEILAYYAGLDVDTLDKKRDIKILELRDCLHKLNKFKDDLLCLKHAKRKELIGLQHSLSKVDQLLQGDDELFKLKRLVLEYQGVRDKIKLELSIIESYFWKAKA